METYRGEPDGLGHKDHYWRAVAGHDVVADGSEGYRRAKDREKGIKATFIALLRWLLKRDRVWVERAFVDARAELLGSITASAGE